MDMASDTMSRDRGSGSTEKAASTTPGALDSPTLRVCFSTSADPAPSKDQRRSASRSWYSQAFPFFSVSLSGDDDVTEVLLFCSNAWH
jgi:hypothetical protein